MALAAEFKRASPSKGDIATHLNAGEQAKKYASAGANIISVLSEQRWFNGTLDDMTEVRLATSGIPDVDRPAILRKEFTTETYQIAEAAAAGADTILLIVAVLPQHVLKRLIEFARNVVGMEPLVEVHTDLELDVAIEAGAKVIGVNNRNLHTFQLDLGTSQQVAAELTRRGLKFDHNDKTSEYSLCALSGMSSAFDVDRYRKVGLGMCLIGESLMRAADPAAAIASLCLHPDDFENASLRQVGGAYTGGTKLVKVCGTTNSEDALKACQEGANMIGVIFVPKSKRCVTADQAKEIVEEVRKFGERTKAVEFPETTKSESPLVSLVGKSLALEEASRRPLVVGVFQNQSPDFIKQIVAECGLDLVQLHGQEGMMAASEDNCGVPAIRVVDIETDPETGKATSDAVENLLQSVTSDPMAILLDTSIKGSKEGGGTGVTFDWAIAEKIQNSGLPVIIAGGLTPDNVKDAVMSVRPWGVDVSSGLEASPGKKDHEKVKKFVHGAREAAKEANKGI
jgi:anthranilate synthase/indole-3-glycerol phosphate synthase/phosphoribosylanthranilate isomerase